MSMEPFWTEINETALRQGDYLPNCLVPEFGPDLAAAGTHEVMANDYDTIVVTQSCDLEQRKVRLVAVCPIYPLAEFEFGSLESPPGISARIRQAREARGLTWYALAKLAGIPNTNTVCDIEYGRDALLSTVQAVAHALGLRLDLIEEKV